MNIASDYYSNGFFVEYRGKDAPYYNQIGYVLPPHNPYTKKRDIEDWDKGFNGQVGGGHIVYKGWLFRQWYENRKEII